MLDLPFELRSRPLYSPALWTDRPGTLSEPPPSCPTTPGPGLYEHNPVAREKIHFFVTIWKLFAFEAVHHISVCHDEATVCVPYLGPVRPKSAGHLSLSQSLFIVFQTGVDLGAITEQYVVHGCWGGINPLIINYCIKKFPVMMRLKSFKKCLLKCDILLLFCGPTTYCLICSLITPVSEWWSISWHYYETLHTQESTIHNLSLQLCPNLLRRKKNPWSPLNKLTSVVI